MSSCLGLEEVYLLEQVESRLVLVLVLVLVRFEKAYLLIPPIMTISRFYIV